MTVRILHAPAGLHSRRGPNATVDTVRHALLRITVGRLDPDHDDELGPVERGMTQRQVRRREWHAIGCAVGDLAENLVHLITVALVGLGVVVAAAVVAVYAPLWVSIPALGAVMVGCAWWLRATSPRVGHGLTDVLGSLDCDVTEQLPVVVDVKQDRENWV